MRTISCETCHEKIDTTVQSYYVTMDGKDERHKFCTEKCLSQYEFESYVVRGGIVPAGS